MSILKAFETAIRKKKERNWDVIYVMVDIHDTIFKGTYSEVEEYEYLGKAKECLQCMSSRKDIVLILWSSIYCKDAVHYLDKFEQDGIFFKHFNANDAEKSTELACFAYKPYFSVGLDDKFGFEPEKDWEEILNYLKHNENN